MSINDIKDGYLINAVIVTVEYQIHKCLTLVTNNKTLCYQKNLISTTILQPTTLCFLHMSNYQYYIEI